MINYSPNSLRQERKFFISGLSLKEVEGEILRHFALFSEIYYERSVNNLYFDTFNWQNYFENLMGLSERQKIRVRWYGNVFGLAKNPVLEFKIKNNNLSAKISYPLNDFVIDQNFNTNTMREVFSQSSIPENIKEELKPLQITLLNTYRRKYFQTPNKKFRLTTDFAMKFYSVGSVWNNFLNKIQDNYNMVLELKYDSPHEQEAEKITQALPFRLTKSSKYALGVEKLNLW